MTRLANLAGALALALTDRLVEADRGAGVEASWSGRAALVTLLAHPDHSVSRLGEVLGLTSSGITRLVDRLADAGWVTRTTGTDARSRHLRLTRSGRRQARSVLEARRAAMVGALDSLSERDRDELERLLDLVVSRLAETRLPAMRICRLCDRAQCAPEGRACPLDHVGAVDRADV